MKYEALSFGIPAAKIPVLMMISERGTLGEFNLGQALVCRTMRPVLASLAAAWSRSKATARS